MAKEKKEECPPKGAPAYMLTYGDMMTLLLTFFVLLLSFSSMRDAKFRRAIGSLQGAMGVLPQEQSVIKPKIVPIPQLTNLQESDISESIVKLEDIVSDLELDEVVKLQVTDEGMVIEISDSTIFESGRTEIRPKLYPILKSIVALAENWPNEIRIEGHTDNVSINTPRFKSNWELSAERAMNVLHFFEECGIQGERLTAIGRADTKPKVPNTSPENRALNRRVEIYIEYDPEVGMPPGLPKSFYELGF